jgi:hypothetical protein
MSSFPNFRKIFQDYRTPEEEKQIANSALFKFCGYVAVAVVAMVMRRSAFAAA